MKKRMPWIIILLVMGGVTTALIYQGKEATKNKKLIDEQIFQEYFQALQQKKYENAWKHYSKNRKEKFSVDELADNYKIVIQDYGNLKSYRIFNVNTTLPFVRKKEYYVTIQFSFEQRMLPITYTLVKNENDSLKIIKAACSLNGLRDLGPW